MSCYIHLQKHLFKAKVVFMIGDRIKAKRLQTSYVKQNFQKVSRILQSYRQNRIRYLQKAKNDATTEMKARRSKGAIKQIMINEGDLE